MKLTFFMILMFLTALTWGAGPERGALLIVNMASRRVSDAASLAGAWYHHYDKSLLRRALDGSAKISVMF